MAFGGPRSSCVRPGAHSARRLRSLAFLGSSSAGLPARFRAGLP